MILTVLVPMTSATSLLLVAALVQAPLLVAVPLRYQHHGDNQGDVYVVYVSDDDDRVVFVLATLTTSNPGLGLLVQMSISQHL